MHKKESNNAIIFVTYFLKKTLDIMLTLAYNKTIKQTRGVNKMEKNQEIIITKEMLKANAKNLFNTLDEINSLQWGPGQTTTAPTLRYINRDEDQGICLEYEYGYKRMGAYRWKEYPAGIDMQLENENPPKELTDRLLRLLERLHLQPEIVKLLIDGEYDSYKEVFSFEIIIRARATEMYQDGMTESYELRLNRAGRVSQTKPRIHRYSYLVAYNID